MAYIGNQPALQYITFAKQTFTANGSTVAFTLDNSVANENELEVFVNNVRQEPGSGKAYTASGTTLTMSEAPNTGDDFYCIYQGKATQTVTPGNGTVSSAHMAAGVIPDNKPAFSAFMGSAQTGIANNTGTNLICDSEDFDSDGAYNTSDGKFTVPAGEGGKYYLHAVFRTNSSGTMTRCNISLYKNGSTVISQFNGNQVSNGEASASASFVGTLAAGDYIQSRMFQDSSSSVNAESGTGKTLFMGFKLIGI
jgi:hypothetical protein